MDKKLWKFTSRSTGSPEANCNFFLALGRNQFKNIAFEIEKLYFSLLSGDPVCRTFFSEVYFNSLILRSHPA